jgi:probable HAF family extracellular repeat protein
MFFRRRLVAARAVTSIAVVAAAVGSGVAGARAEPGRQPRLEVTMTELRGPDGEPLERVLAINERGQIVTMTNTQRRDDEDVVLWHRGGATRLDPEGVDSSPIGISDQGHVTGVFSDEEHRPAPFLWSRGEWRTLPVGDAVVYPGAVNDQGQVLMGEDLGGSYPHRHFVMAVWQGDRVTRTPVYEDVQLAGAIDINDRGQAVYFVAPKLENGPIMSTYLWQVGGEVTDLGNLGEAWTQATDINDRGQVVGASSLIGPDGTPETHPFLWEDGEMTDLGTLGGPDAIADDINNRGQIVGRSSTEGGDYIYRHGFVWEDGEMTDLYASIEGPLYPHYGGYPLDINDRGQIAGTVPIGITGQAFRWTVR